MIDIKCNNISTHKTWEEMIKAFFDYIPFEEYDENILFEITKNDNSINLKIFKDKELFGEGTTEISPLDEVRATKVLIYEVLSRVLKRDLPWGTLTGIRPVSFFNWTKKQYGNELGREIFSTKYHVRSDKVELCEEIENIEHKTMTQYKDNHLIYIHIPFCETRCNYCSFSVMTMDKFGKWMDKYFETLLKEIEEGYDILPPEKACSLYIGGGTPSTLSIEKTKKLLSVINEKFKNLVEITFEAGRPESITTELLEVLQSEGVSRISINPQSMQQKTLDSIGRKHTVEDIYAAFERAKKYDIDVNTDMIIGFEGEGVHDVTDTLSKLIALEPENITVHSLALKTGSRIKNQNVDFSYEEFIDRRNIYDILRKNSYRPYYLYRQKRQVGEAENIGFSKEGKENIFNILSMNDENHVLAFGMGAVSKFVDKNLDCHRVFGFRDVIYYIEHLNELNENKREIVEKYL